MPRKYVLLDWESASWLAASPQFRGYLKNYFQSAWVGILYREDHVIDNGLIDALKDDGPLATIFFYIKYTQSLSDSVAACKVITPPLQPDDSVFLITNNKKDQQEARRLGWSGVALKTVRGLFDENHVSEMQFRIERHFVAHSSTYSQRLETEKKPRLVISWDIDEMLIYYYESLFLKKIVFNPHALLFFKKFFQDYGQRFEIEIVVLTARLKCSPLDKIPDFMSAEKVVEEFCELTGIPVPKNLLPHNGESGCIYYVDRKEASKHHLLASLYSRKGCPVIHFDDNEIWWSEENTIPHLFLVSVKNILREQIKFSVVLHDDSDSLFELWPTPVQSLDAYGTDQDNLSQPLSTPSNIFTKESQPLLIKCPESELRQEKDDSCCPGIQSFFKSFRREKFAPGESSRKEHTL